MRHFLQPKKFQVLSIIYATTACVIMAAFISSSGCQAEDTLAKAEEDSITCDDNKLGWFCVSNPELSVDPADGLTENQRVMCDGSGHVTNVETCPDICQVQSSGTDDICAESTSTTCQGNMDGWYCATNSELNVDPGDEYFDTDLVHCDGFKVVEIVGCEDGCAINESGVDDVCSTASTTCNGNKDKWYCATNLELNKDPTDDIDDTDMILCQGGDQVDMAYCQDCTVNASGVDDTCVGGYCGDTIVQSSEECDKTNLNSHTCQSEGYDGGDISCTEFCMLEITDCCDDSCTGDTQCVGTTKQTCQDSNGDGCKEWVNTGTCSSNPVCSNGVIEGSEVCDSSNMNGHTCEGEGFDDGNISCTGSCTLNTTGCCNDSCTGTTQCVGTVQQTCQDGNGDGCSEWVNTGTCAPTCTTQIASNACYTWTSSAGGMYEIFEICAEKIGDNRIRVHMRKNPISSFGTRPYGLRVFGASDPECSHSTYFYNEPTGGVTVTGIGTNELKMEFDVTWGTGQTSKRFCGFAKTQSGDTGYDPYSDEQKIWWYSRSFLVNKVCN